MGKEQLLQLKNLVHNDIIGSINANLKVKNITIEDALKLKRYTQKLCDYLYANHKELGVLKDMTDESFMTDIDILCKEHEEEIVKRDKTISKKDESLSKIQKKRISAICKKLQKGKSLAEIAEDLEEDVIDISPIYEASNHFAPDYDVDLIYAAVKDII